jgi:glycosyltransferase involved in cell wall biosynthesis|tara:strand:- start:29162 stop:30634 length:1473 start_codon:yes stop_codon:yes gene_type:complete
MSIKLPKLKKVDFNKEKKKKILLLSDDLRLHSGVGTMSREIVYNTCHKYDWVQVGGAIKHPDKGKRIDVSAEVRSKTGVDDANVIVFPFDGYGNPEILRHLIATEKPDAIMHFTDPRFWGWLYQMEHEIRQHIPLIYLNIWDDLPYPHWNEPFYESCDLLMAISKQTYNINNQVCQRKPRVEGVDLTYVPHGIDHKDFFPIDVHHPEFSALCEFKQQILKGSDPEFLLFFNSRNIRRKGPANLLLAYRLFCDSLSKEEAQNVCLLLHTDRVDNNGTDLPAVKNALCPEYNVKFTSGKFDTKHLNYLYNMSSLTCQPSSAEGFGLSVCESLMSGTPIMATVLGGLQDQMGFKKEDGTYLGVLDYSDEFPSNSNGKYKNHGEWAFPLWPQLTLQGSPATPYIYDSIPNIKDIAKSIKEAYSLGEEELNRKGLLGREFVTSSDAMMTAEWMGKNVINSIEKLFTTFKPRERFQLSNSTEKQLNYPQGIILEKI